MLSKEQAEGANPKQLEKLQLEQVGLGVGVGVGVGVGMGVGVGGVATVGNNGTSALRGWFSGSRGWRVVLAQPLAYL